MVSATPVSNVPLPFSAKSENNVPVKVIVRVPSVLSPALSPEPISWQAIFALRFVVSARA